jgi:hypothetical protein
MPNSLCICRASRPIWHSSHAGLPVVALDRLQVETDGKSIASAKQAIQKDRS